MFALRKFSTNAANAANAANARSASKAAAKAVNPNSGNSTFFDRVMNYALRKDSKPLYRIAHHPISLISKRLEEILVEISESENAKEQGEKGNSLAVPKSIFNLHAAGISPIVSVRENFDDLRIFPGHPSRSAKDTFYIDGEKVLRTHTSTLQIPTLKSLLKVGGKGDCQESLAFTMVADVYRNDVIDASHYPIFHQMEGFAWFPRSSIIPSMPSGEYNNGTCLETFHPLQDPGQARSILNHLKQTLEKMMKMLFKNDDMKFRWVETTFPFTRPSLEMEIHASCIPGMQVKDGDEWLEVLGCGVINQDILAKMGHPYDCGEGWAFGIGIERIAMLYFGISDIRTFWTENPAFLANFQEHGLKTIYRPLSPHPTLYRDISFWVYDRPISSSSNNKDSVKHLQSMDNRIYILGPNSKKTLLQSINRVIPFTDNRIAWVELIDEFKSQKKGATSLCFRITYQNHDGPMSQTDADPMHASIIQELMKSFDNIELRI